jgi:hypothetical protein
MAALYHALGMSRILEGLVVFRGLVERPGTVGCGAGRQADKKSPSRYAGAKEIACNG